MQSIVIFRRLQHEATAKEFLTPDLVSHDEYEVTLEVSEWVPMNVPDETYFLDAGQPDDPEDSVTCITFFDESETGTRFRLKGKLFPDVTCKKAPSAN